MWSSFGSVRSWWLRGNPGFLSQCRLTERHSVVGPEGIQILSPSNRGARLQGSRVGVHMWLFFQRADEQARPWQTHVKIVDLEGTRGDRCQAWRRPSCKI